MFDDIYDIFKLELDGEEFDSDDDALLSGNLAYREILNNRDWKFLKKTYTLPAGSFDLSVIPLDKVLDVWCNGVQLKKATFENRFDTSKDYWIDYANKRIVSINNLTSQLIVDYKYRPADLDEETPAVEPDLMNPVIAYQMGLNYMRKDQDTTVYAVLQDKFNQGFNLLIDHNENL
jgi:hypothetical protein